MKATEQFFPVVLFTTLIIQMKATVVSSAIIQIRYHNQDIFCLLSNTTSLTIYFQVWLMKLTLETEQKLLKFSSIEVFFIYAVLRPVSHMQSTSSLG